MPIVKAWADELRAVFGAADIAAGLKSQGYFARENGHTVDTRRPETGTAVCAAAMVIARPEVADAKMPAEPARRARRG